MGLMRGASSLLWSEASRVVTGMIDKDGAREKASGTTRGNEDDVLDSLAAA
jgi:hypothetical protein